MLCVRVVFWNPGFRDPAVTESVSHHIEPPLTKIMRRIALWKSHVCPLRSQHNEIVNNDVNSGSLVTLNRFFSSRDLRFVEI